MNILKDYLDPFDEKTLEKSRIIAARGLRDYPEVIKKYWNSYGLDKYEKNINLNTISHLLDGENKYYIILMPLDILIKVTKETDLLTRNMNEYVRLSSDFRELEQHIRTVIMNSKEELIKYELRSNNII
jgi:hypothetical protein